MAASETVATYCFGRRVWRKLPAGNPLAETIKTNTSLYNDGVIQLDISGNELTPMTHVPEIAENPY